MTDMSKFQDGVDAWMDACFGETIKHDQLERADRFLEEALELAQTMPSFTKDRAYALVDYVFGRPIGRTPQEVGGVMVTLAALCNINEIDIQGVADNELARVWTKVEQIRAKQASKPTGSALPIPTAETVTLPKALYDEWVAADDAALDWADANARWFDISTAPRDGTEFYAAPLNEDPWIVYYQAPSESHPDHIWMDDREQAPFHRDAFAVWRPITAPPPLGQLPAPLEALGAVLRRVKGCE